MMILPFQRSYTHKLLHQGRIVYLRYGLPRYGLAASFNQMEAGGLFQSPMCRQRAARSRVAMRAAYLVLMVLGEDRMSLQSLEFLLCHIQHLSIPMNRLVAFCVLIGPWVTLGLTCRLTISLVGQRILTMVMVFSLKSRTAPISYKVCLSINQVVQRCLSSLRTPMSGVSFTDLLAEYSVQDVSITPTFLYERCRLKYHTTVRQPSSWQVCTFGILF